MPKGRDWLWAVGICGLLLLAFHYRPLWNARRFVQHESEAGFFEAYAGHRWVNGAVISNGGGAVTDVMATPILSRRLQIEAENVSLNGRRAEFVVRHIVKLAGPSPGGEDRSQEVHVKLRRRGSGWDYTHFQVRGRPALTLPVEGNPWALKN